MQTLNSLLTAWKTTLADAGELSPVEIDELESHLLDSMDDLQAKGLTPEESFLIAQRRMGPADQLGAEFEKTNPQLRVQRVLLWMLSGIFSFFMVQQIFSAIAHFTSWVMIPLVGSFFGALVGIVLMALFLVGGIVIFRRACTGRYSNWFTQLFQRAARLHPAIMIAALFGATLISQVANVGMSTAMRRNSDGTDLTLGYSVQMYGQLILSLLLLVAVPMLIHSLRKTQSAPQPTSVQR